MVKIISWNIARRHAAWRCLPGSDADIALLQEASLPPDDVAARIEVDPALFHKDSLNVPTYRHSSGTEHQLDFVFASESMANSVKVSALNGPDDWGPSDHCRIEVTVEP